MRKYLIGISAAAIVALAAGCGAGDDAATQNRQTTTPSEQAAAHNDQDVAFAQQMIPHHQQALDMAKMAATKATDPAVKDLAGRIEKAQDPEIQEMTAMLSEWGAPTEPESGHGGMDHGGGMMTDDQMAQLDQANGGGFDRMWLQMMIEHHEGAVTMAQTELEKGSDTDAKALAQRIVDAQQDEIAEMEGMVS